MKLKSLSKSQMFYFIALVLFVFSFIKIVRAATPNPGHNFSSIGGGAVQGDILYGSAADTISALAKNTTATRYIANTGTSNNPAWAQVDLTNGVTGILTSVNGGTGNGFAKFTGPATSEKTFTLPNVTTTILTDNDDVTLAQGGTGATLTASNGGIFYSTGSVGAILSGTATANKVLMSGSSAAPVWSTPTYPNASATSGKVIISDGTNYIASTPTFPNAAGTAGNELVSDGTNFVSTAPADQVLFRPLGFDAANLTAVTALATNTSYLEYMGPAEKAFTTCNVLANVTTAAATITWAEVAVFKGTPPLNTTASLTRLGFTNVAATFNSTGIKNTAVTLSGAAVGDRLWAALGSQATTPFQVRGGLADNLQSGWFQTGARPSTAASPFTSTLAGATTVPAWLVMKCT